MVLFPKIGLPEAAARAKHQGFGTPEKVVLLRNGPPNPDFGESRDPNGLYGVQEAFGRASFPPNPTKPQFLEDFLVLGDFGQGPWALPISPLWAYWAYLALCGPAWWALACVCCYCLIRLCFLGLVCAWISFTVSWLS